MLSSIKHYKLNKLSILPQFDSLLQSGLFLDGAYKLAAKINKKPLITEVMFCVK